ncbi:MAG: hypothetical protein IJF54_00015 [Clostridia bacterium]|nr:hypothetical protein [Clostridia bacterium]
MQKINVFDRHIDVNEQNKLISVCNNALTEALIFSVNRFVDNGVDLSKLSCYIKTQNADDFADLIIPEVTASEDKILVKWIISSATTAKAGPIKVQLLFQATELDTATVWQTDVAEFEIIGTLKNADEIEELYPTMFQQWDAKMIDSLTQINQKADEVEANRINTVVAKDAAMGYAADAARCAFETETALNNARIAFSPSIISEQRGTYVNQKMNTDAPYKAFNVVGKTTVIPNNPDLQISPDNPAELSGISGTVGFNLMGENLCYLDKSVKTGFGLTINYDDITDEIIINGTATSNGTIVFNSSNIKIMIPQGFMGRLSVTETASEKPDDVFIGIRCHDSTFLTSINFPKAKTSVAINFTANKNYLIKGFSIWVPKGAVFDNYKIKACLSARSVTGYPKTFLENHSISIPETQKLLSIDDATYDYIDFVNSKHIKNIEMRNVSVDEDFEIQNLDSEYCFIHFPVLDAASDSKILSDKFSTNMADDEFVKFENGRCYLKIKKSRLPVYSIEGFKFWVSANPVRILYKKAQPVITDFELPKITNGKDIAYITADSSQGYEFQVEYVKDTESVINELVAAIVALGGNVDV